MQLYGIYIENLCKFLTLHAYNAAVVLSIGYMSTDSHATDSAVAKAAMCGAMQERKRAAMLLSQLPADIDIALLLQAETSATASATTQKARKANAIAPSSAFKSARAD